MRARVGTVGGGQWGAIGNNHRAVRRASYSVNCGLPNYVLTIFSPPAQTLTFMLK
jgi:hypothetical protein